MEDQLTCTIEASPAEVDAGAPFALQVLVTGPKGFDLPDDTIVVLFDAWGKEVARPELVEREDGSFATEFASLIAPRAAGEVTYRATLGAFGSGKLVPRTSAEISVPVTAHAAYLNMWGVPSAIVAGEPFSFRIGIKCSCGCDLGGRAFRVLDAHGAELAAGQLGREIWPGTTALYFAEITLPAPTEAGAYGWTVETPGSDAAFLHAPGSAALSLKVVPSPDHEVMVEVIDREKQTPIKGMHVLLHPYRALTDAHGVAKIRVAKGSYSLHVSGLRYIPYRDQVDAAGDVALRAELTIEPPPSAFYPQPILR